jgi:hypothetical protein
MALPIWSSCCKVLSVAGVVGLAAAAGRRDPATPLTIRPAVALSFEITAPVYRGLLRDRQCVQACRTLQRQLEESLRVILSRRFGFVHWEAGGPPPADTAQLRLMQSGASPVANPVREVTVRGQAAGRVPSLPLPFETWAEASQRAGTDAASLRAAWIRKADSILAEKGPQAVTEILGRVPLNADVTLDAASLKAHVAIPRDTISAAETPRPEFVVRIEVRETVPFPTVDSVGLVLRRCKAHTGVGYVCEMDEVVPSDPSAPIQAPREVMNRAQIKVVSLHLKQYWARTVATAPGGALPPGGTP